MLGNGKGLGMGAGKRETVGDGCWKMGKNWGWVVEIWKGSCEDVEWRLWQGREGELLRCGDGCSGVGVEVLRRTRDGEVWRWWWCMV